jgi:hypothetical protein
MSLLLWRIELRAPNGRDGRLRSGDLQSPRLARLLGYATSRFWGEQPDSHRHKPGSQPGTLTVVLCSPFKIGGHDRTRIG